MVDKVLGTTVLKTIMVIEILKTTVIIMMTEDILTIMVVIDIKENNLILITNFPLVRAHIRLKNQIKTN